MTPEQLNFEAVLRERLAERARTLITADEQVRAFLQRAREYITQLLAAQPSDWQLWHLQRLRDQIELSLQASGQQASAAIDGLLRELWQQGEDLIDKPLAAAGYGVETTLGTLDVRVLSAMRSFAADRLTNVTAEAAARIGQQIGLVTIGGTSPFDAIRAVQRILGSDSPRRASAIVQTEASRAFAVASLQRIREAARLVPGLCKQWRRSGKPESRWQHDLVDGQVQGVDLPFRVSNPNGGVDEMQCPHDPTAPPEQVINCGCTLLPFRRGWQVMHPGAKPFTQRELERSPGKEQLDRQAKAAGMRLAVPPNQSIRPELQNVRSAIIPKAKLRKYALDPTHKSGGNKSIVLSSALGFTLENADELERQILAGIQGQLAYSHLLDKFGQRWTVDVPVTGPIASGTVRTGWIVRPGNDIPQLTTVRFLPESKVKKPPNKPLI